MMMVAYSRALMLIVSPMSALAACAWMGSGHWRCHQNWRSVEYPPAAWDEESKYVIVDGSLGMRGQWGNVQDQVVVKDQYDEVHEVAKMFGFEMLLLE